MEATVGVSSPRAATKLNLPRYLFSSTKTPSTASSRCQNSTALFETATTPSSRGSAQFTIIANVPFDTVRQDLVTEFRKFGRVELAMVVCDEASRHPHKEWTSTAGYAFVRFSRRAEAAAAIQAANIGLITIRGTRVRADWARKDSYAKRGRVSSSQGAPALGPHGLPNGISLLHESLNAASTSFSSPAKNLPSLFSENYMTGWEPALSQTLSQPLPRTLSQPLTPPLDTNMPANLSWCPPTEAALLTPPPPGVSTPNSMLQAALESAFASAFTFTPPPPSELAPANKCIDEEGYFNTKAPRSTTADYTDNASSTPGDCSSTESDEVQLASRPPRIALLPSDDPSFIEGSVAVLSPNSRNLLEGAINDMTLPRQLFTADVSPTS